MKKLIKSIIVIAIAAMAIGITGFSANTAETVYAGDITLSSTGNAQKNKNQLERALKGDDQKTVTIVGEYHITQAVKVGSNKTIIATGATIIQDSVQNGQRLFSNVDDAGGHDSVTNVHIEGGTWYYNNNSTAYSAFRFTHGSNITFSNMTIYTNYKSHAIELIAVDNASITNCTILANRQAEAGIDKTADMIQIDGSTTTRVAPNLSVYDKIGCSNITISGCTVSGPRGICANYDKSYKKTTHSNITITGCNITGTNTEAVALYNTLDITVKNNTIVTQNKKTSKSYSVGLYIQIAGKITKDVNSSSVTITKNTIKGGRQAINVTTSKKSLKYGDVTIKNNKLYCRKGKSNVLLVNGARSTDISSNKAFNWKS